MRTVLFEKKKKTRLWENLAYMCAGDVPDRVFVVLFWKVLHIQQECFAADMQLLLGGGIVLFVHALQNHIVTVISIGERTVYTADGSG